MPTLGETIDALLQRAGQSGECVQLADEVRRKRERYVEAGGSLATGIKVGAGLVVLGAIVSIFVLPLGIGMAIGGAATMLVGASSQADRMKERLDELIDAMERLRDCLG